MTHKQKGRHVTVATPSKIVQLPGRNPEGTESAAAEQAPNRALAALDALAERIRNMSEQEARALLGFAPKRKRVRP